MNQHNEGDLEIEVLEAEQAFIARRLAQLKKPARFDPFKPLEMAVDAGLAGLYRLMAAFAERLLKRIPQRRR